MSWFEDLTIDRAQETPHVEGDIEAGKRLLYILRCCCKENKAAAISDKTEGQWVAVNDAWIKLLGWTAEDMNAAVENPFHPDDFDSLLLVHSMNNLAAPYRIRIRKKWHAPGTYGWFKLEGLSVVIDDHIIRCSIVEPA